MDRSTFLHPRLKSSLVVAIIVVLFCSWLFWSILGFRAEDSHNFVLSILYLVEFGVHEASHLVFAFLPSIAVAAAGSIGEMTFTILLLIACLSRKAWLGVVFAGQWIMLAFNSAGRYMADARAQQLPLIGPGENPQHDWHYVFGQLRILQDDTLIGGIVCISGDVVGALALAYGIYLIVYKMTSSRRAPIG